MQNVVKKYLELSNYTHEKENFEDFFTSHPNFPSIFALTDALHALSIENIALKIPKEQFIELPESFLAIYNDEVVLTKKSTSNITIETENGKMQKLTYNEFLSGWNQVIVAIEPSSEVAVLKAATNTKVIHYIAPFLLLTLVSFCYNQFTIVSALLLATSIIGLLLSIFIVQEKLGITNDLATKFCNINPSASCNSVIKSSKSDINKWLGFSDLPLLFFSCSFLALILQPIAASTTIGFLSLLSVPVIGYSIWLQKVQIKKWCVLCLAVSSVLVLQSLVFGFTSTSFSNLELVTIYSFLFSSILLSSVWLFVKPIFEAKIKAQKAEGLHKKFKRNFEVFNFLSKKIPFIKGFTSLNGLQFGNKNANTQLTLILSPSCGHCHKAFEDGMLLVKKFPERISLQVLFNINPENNDNPYKAVVETLLAINNINPENAESAISDWHIKKMDLESWLKKWKMNSLDMKVNHQIHLQYNWCLENEFNYTPVKLVNDKLFPNEYEINELKYFLNNFSQEKEENLVLEKL